MREGENNGGEGAEEGAEEAHKRHILLPYALLICLCEVYDPKMVRKIVKELSLDAARHRFLCRNIEIRTIGFGGEFQDKYEITWSQNGKMRSVKELSEHLRRIIWEEKNMEIPEKPPENVP